MNTKQVEYILELAKTLNFNHAAENLNISQPTMTYQIKAVEEEIGFCLFIRSGKGVTLTPAGEQFIITLTTLKNVLNRSIQQGRENNSKYQDNIKFVIPSRSYINFLPMALKEFEKNFPTTNISLSFDFTGGLDSFLKGDKDLAVALKNDVKRYHNIKTHHIYDSHFYVVMPKDNPLSDKSLISANDLDGYTFQIGANVPLPMLSIQNKIIKQLGASFNICNDFDTALVKIAAGQGIAIAPGFLNEHSDKFAWIRLDTNDSLNCVLCSHGSDTRPSLLAFIKLLQSFYKENPDFPI